MKDKKTMNNWEKLGLGSMEEGQMHVLKFLKENEEKIMSRAVSDESIISCGEYALHLTRKAPRKKK